MDNWTPSDPERVALLAATNRPLDAPEPDRMGNGGALRPEWYEPWTPRQGDQVRVRLSGECMGGRPDLHWGGGDPPRHGGWEDGLVGWVMDCPWGTACPCRDDAHHVAVWFDAEALAARGAAVPDGVEGSHFAVVELEPVRGGGSNG